MSQTRTAAFTAAAAARAVAPILLVRAALSGGTRYWTSRGGQYPAGGQYYAERLLEGLELSIGLDPLGRALRAFGAVVLANGQDGAGDRPSDLFASEVLANAAVEIDLLFHDLVHPTDSLRLFTGALDVPEDDCFDDAVCRLRLMDDGNPLWAGIQHLAAARIHRMLGTRINATDYPGADPDAVGRVQPIIYGRLPDAPAIPVDAGGLDVLQLDATSSQTALYLSDPVRWGVFPASGTAQLEDEQVTYTGKAAHRGSALATSGAGTTYTARRCTDAAAWDLSGAHVGDIAVAGASYGVVAAVDDASDYLEVTAWVGGTPADTTVCTVHAPGWALTGCTRGAGSTAAAAHAAGVQVWEVQAGYVYLVSQHACASVTNVRADGVLVDPADYTVDLSGPTTITFSSRPRRSLDVLVLTQPTYSASVTAEQSPGTVSVTAEQSPGTISTTAEQGVSTATGSHGHTGDKGIHEYPTSPAVPWTSVSATQNFSFANSGKTGTTANWHVQVTATSGTWQIRTGGGGVVATLSYGDNFFTEAATPGTSYQLYESASGTISVAMVERDLTVTASTTSNAATGVAASMTGATATSMASLSGATAANMASLSGSTAVSVAQTANAVVSAADVVVGESVVCDVEGIVDDGSGTYTGTAGALITNPADQIRHILAVQLGLPLADWADSASFGAARTAFDGASIRCDWGLYDQIDSAELLERIRWSVGARLFQGATGAFKLFALPLAGSSVLTLTEADDVLDEQAGGGPIRVGRTALADLYNEIFVLGAKRLAGDGYGDYATAEDATSQSDYRMTRSLIIENDFVRDATALQAIADVYLAWHKDQRWRATVRALAWPVLHLEPCDTISLTSPRMPGGWTTKAFLVERIQWDLLRPGRPSLATLTLREA